MQFMMKADIMFEDFGIPYSSDQSGIPVLSVRSHLECHPTKIGVNLAKKRYFQIGSTWEAGPKPQTEAICSADSIFNNATNWIVKLSTKLETVQKLEIVSCKLVCYATNLELFAANLKPLATDVKLLVMIN